MRTVAANPRSARWRTPSFAISLASITTILCVESNRHRCSIVGEDLGTVPQYVPTFAGFWRGRDIDDRVDQGLLDENGAREERNKRQRLRGRIRDFVTAQGLLPQEGDDTRVVLEALLRFSLRVPLRSCW